MPGVDAGVPVYPIGVVQRLTGLSARQIRYYEKEGLLTPSRTRGNRRLFSPADVDRLRQVKGLMEQGLTLEGVRALLAAGPGQEVVEPAGTAGDAAQAGAPGPAGPGQEAGASPEPEGAGREVPAHPALFRQARGRRLSSLFPVDQQAELVRWLEEQREEQPQREP